VTSLPPVQTELHRHLDVSIRTAEFRFSLAFVSEFNSLSWKEILESFKKGLDRAKVQHPDLQTGLLCIASRDYEVEAAG
jgi:hypothetical protein